MIPAVAFVVAQLAIVAEAPAQASACEPITVTVQTRAAGPESPRIVLPDFSPFVLTRSSATPRLSSDHSGRMWAVDEYKYIISTARPGRYVIPPFEARLRGKFRRSKPMVIRVTSIAESDSVPAIIGSALLRGPGPVHFEGLLTPDTVYVGEQVTYQAAAFVEDSVQSRLRRNPEFFPPEMRAMLTYELPFVRGYLPRPGTRNECFEVPVFQRAIFPLTAGRHVIPPAQLVFSVPRAFSFFGREESRDLYTDTLVLVALEPPDEGRPDDYTGAVGALSVEARIDSVGQVGDPLTLTVAVRGAGNVKFLPRPTLTLPWATLVPAAERVEIVQGAVVRGTKEFDWVVTPRVAGQAELPPIRYPFFDPSRESYEIALTDPRSLLIAPGLLSAAPLSSRDSVMLAIRRSYRGELPRPVHDRPLFWALLLAAPVPALALGAVRRPVRRRRPRSAVTVLRAIARRRSADARVVRRAYVLALADRLRLNAELLTRRGGLARALRRAGVTTGVAADAEALLHALDEAAYARDPAADPAAARRAMALFQQVDREALPKASIARRSRLGGSSIAGGLALVLAAAATGVGASGHNAAAARLFEHGVSAYDAGDFPAATRAFATLTRSAPRAPDAWANLGTSSWAARDTAMATAGWQRALRLEPRADEVRARLTALHGEQLGRVGRVPTIAAGPVALAAAASWLLAWTLAIFAFTLRRDWLRSATRISGLAALVLGAVAVRVATELDARELAVVATEEPLRALPALSAEDVGAASIGEIVRERERQGRWTQVERANGRRAWIESHRLIPLGDR